MKKELPLIACSLDERGLADRLDEFRALFRTALLSSEQIDGGARLRFDTAAADAVRDLLAREKDCCPWWDFSFEQTADALVVTAPAPPDAAPLVERLLPRG